MYLANICERRLKRLNISRFWFRDLTDKKGLNRIHPRPGDTFKLGKGLVTVLGPVEVRKNDSNENSVVIRIDYGEESFLFTGDAEHKSEEDMLRSGENLKCNVLVPGHHGSATGTTWDFLRKTLPEAAVISCGETNSYGHPSVDVMEKLESMEIPVYRTDTQGDIVCTTDGKSLVWSKEASGDYSGRDGGTKPSKVIDEEKETVKEPLNEGEGVWISRTGKKYHSINNCGRMNPNTSTKIKEEEAVRKGMERCSKCW